MRLFKLFFLILILVSFIFPCVIAGGGSDLGDELQDFGLSSGDQDQIEPKKVTEVVNDAVDPSNEIDVTATTTNANIETETDAGEVNIQNGNGEISINNDGVTIESVDEAEIFDSELGLTEDLHFTYDGTITATKTDYFSAGSFSAKNIKNLNFDGSKVTFDSAEEVEVGIFEFDNLDESEMEIDGKNLEITFPSKKSFVFPNPFSKQDKDNDKLIDSIEISLSLNPNKVDSDDDGISDYEDCLFLKKVNRFMI